MIRWDARVRSAASRQCRGRAPFPGRLRRLGFCDPREMVSAEGYRERVMESRERGLKALEALRHAVGMLGSI